MSRRERPPDGPGANGLRGGRNAYSLKTANGNWIEDCGGAACYKRGFTSDNFQTECQHQQTGRSLQKDPEFGAALPRRYADPRTTTDVFNPPSGPQGDCWETNTQLMMKSTIGARVLQTTNQAPKSNVDPVALETYRKSWTNDTEESRKMRFQTESRRAGNGSAPAKFAVESVRFLPGCPIAFERFRERLIERFGILAMSSVRSAIAGRTEMSSAEFYDLIKETGVKMSRIEIEQMLGYLTASDTLPTEKVLRLIKGRMESSSTVIAQKSFDALVYNVSDSATPDSSVVTIDQCSLLLNAKKYPDIVEGVIEFLPAYCNGDELSAEGFMLLCHDMHNSAPGNYETVMKSLWGDLM